MRKKAALRYRNFVIVDGEPLETNDSIGHFRWMERHRLECLVGSTRFGFASVETAFPGIYQTRGRWEDPRFYQTRIWVNREAFDPDAVDYGCIFGEYDTRQEAEQGHMAALEKLNQCANGDMAIERLRELKCPVFLNAAFERYSSADDLAYDNECEI